jgi:hypothetical protein
VVEDQLVVFVEKLNGVAEGRKSFRTPFFPSPLPDRIEVGVADEVDSGSAHNNLHGDP